MTRGRILVLKSVTKYLWLSDKGDVKHDSGPNICLIQTNIVSALAELHWLTPLASQAV